MLQHSKVNLATVRNTHIESQILNKLMSNDFNVFTRYWYEPAAFWGVYKSVLHSFKEPICSELPPVDKDINILKEKLDNYLLKMSRVARDTLIFILSFLNQIADSKTTTLR